MPVKSKLPRVPRWFFPAAALLPGLLISVLHLSQTPAHPEPALPTALAAAQHEQARPVAQASPVFTPILSMPQIEDISLASPLTSTISFAEPSSMPSLQTDPVAAPEPASLALLASGAAVLLLKRSR